MKTILFLDDERNIGDVYWHKYDHTCTVITVRTYKEFKDSVKLLLLTIPLSDIVFSFDHDIQDFNEDGSENTGYTCVKWLCDFIFDYEFETIHYIIHSQNPIGSQNINCYINNFLKFKG